MKELPIARGLIVCGQIIVDAETRSPSLISCITKWPVSRFPSSPAQFSIYSTLTNGIGECRLQVRITHLLDDLVIYDRQVPYRFSDPLTVVKFSLRVKQSIFPEAGRYAVQLFADDEPIAETVLHLLLSEEDT